MTAKEKAKNFFHRLWREIEPVLNHTIVAAVISGLVSLLIRTLEIFLPQFAEDLQKIDHFLINTVLWMLAYATITLLGIRIMSHIISEVIMAFKGIGNASKTIGNETKVLQSEEAAQRRLIEERQYVSTDVANKPKEEVKH